MPRKVTIIDNDTQAVTEIAEPIDLDALGPQQLSYPPAEITSSELAMPTDSTLEALPRRVIYTETLPARIVQSIIDGPGAIAILIGMLVIVGGFAVAGFVENVMGAIDMIKGWVGVAASYANIAVGLLMLIGLGVLLSVLFGNRGTGGTISVRPCPKSGITGPINIPASWLRNGR